MTTSAVPQTSFRRFLFLQGCHGPFFSLLAARLMADGHSVRRVNFNGGDKQDWAHDAAATDYIGTEEDFPAWLERHVADFGITDIAFYSYWRPVHQAAMHLAQKKGVRLHGFEEGLLRPNWIMCDPRLPCEQAEDYRARILRARQQPGWGRPSLQQARWPKLPFSTPRMLWNCVWHYFGFWRYKRLFRNYRTHRTVSVGAETMAFLRQSALYVPRKVQSRLRQRDICRSRKPFYLLCLQLEGDSQIRQYADHKTMRAVIEDVIAAFARSAPTDCNLVIKAHPLDNGVNNHEKAAQELAAQHGVADRVVFLWYGKMAPFLRRAKGMITINSTTGLSALYHKCPVKPLGRALYNIPDLADMRDLDDFLANPAPPCLDTWHMLHRMLVETSQIDGNYHVPACYPDLLDTVAERMLPQKDGMRVVPTHESWRMVG